MAELKKMIHSLQAENEKLRQEVASRKRKISSSSSSSEEDLAGEGGLPEVVIIEPSQSKDLKWRLIESCLPLSSNEGFLNILSDHEGREILSRILDEEIRRFTMDDPNIDLDTSATGKGVTRPTRNLASRIVHALFSDTYIGHFKVYDPRTNYKQKTGTAMHEEVYIWLESVVMASIGDFHRLRDRENLFKWEEFLSLDLRLVWRWTRSNIAKKKRKN